MRKPQLQLCTAGAFLVLTLGAALPAASETVYTITELGSFRVGGYGLATAINNYGQVVGYSETSRTESQFGSSAYIFHAFRWDPGTPNGTTGVLKDLGAVNGKYSAAHDINDAGQVVGWTGANPGWSYYSRSAFIHNGQTMKVLPMPAGQNWSEAFGINSLGDVVGHASYDSSIDRYAIRWSLSDTLNLGSLASGQTVYGNTASKIDASGRVIGVSDNRAFQTAPYSSINPATDALASFAVKSNALGCNANGDIVGFYMDASLLEHAFLHHAGNTIDLGAPLPGDTQTGAYGISDNGDIVGRSFWSEFIYSTRVDHNTAVIWRNGVMVDLNTLIQPGSGWYLEWARDINNAGQIVCHGRRADFSTGELLLTIAAPATDTATVSKAEYRPSNGNLTVAASSTTTNVTMNVYVTSTNTLIGPLTSLGGGKFKGSFTLASNPVNITVRSSGGGSASKAVIVR